MEKRKTKNKAGFKSEEGRKFNTLIIWIEKAWQ